jgi:pimeloyl-ACP methyl ester carboxylesterase
MDRQAEVFKLSVPEADSDVEVLEFLKLIPMLTSPSQFGGDPAESFTVVAPSLPGYGLSFSPNQPRFGVEEIADCFASLMSDVLGYKRFGAQGGDWGSFITSRLAYSHGDRMIGINLNMMPLRRDPKMVANPTSEERKYLARKRLATNGSRGRGLRPLRSRSLTPQLVSPRGS